MNAGLTNLAKLKRSLMPPSMVERTDFDDMLITLGVGVAMLMENHCARRFTRLEEDTHEQSANNVVFSVPRYPIETISSVMLKSAANGDETNIAADMQRANLKAGLVHYDEPPGREHDTVIITYSGGFWWDTSEDNSGVMPEGASALPADLQTAFLLQMMEVVRAQDLFGTGAAGDEDSKKKTSSATLDLIPAVRTILNPYRRFA